MYCAIWVKSLGENQPNARTALLARDKLRKRPPAVSHLLNLPSRYKQTVSTLIIKSDSKVTVSRASCVTLSFELTLLVYQNQ